MPIPKKTQGYGLCSPDTILKMLSDKASEINYQKCWLASILYRCIRTNDNGTGLKEIVESYNQRASTERCFDCMCYGCRT